jgi:hypothetical protein
MFENPVTELKRRQNPKRPLPLLFLPEWPQYFLKRSKGCSEPTPNIVSFPIAISKMANFPTKSPYSCQFSFVSSLHSLGPKNVHDVITGVVTPVCNDGLCPATV